MIEKIILGSKSPRRQELIYLLGYPVEIRIQEVEENYPLHLPVENVPEYLAQLKAEPLVNELNETELLLTSDTVVIFEGEILGKPKNSEQAKEYLNLLSGNTHLVITGVFMASKIKQLTFSHTTEVTFNALTQDDITKYISEENPLDKAGAYGIQDWIGQIGVKHIKGSYLNVVGLPLADVKERLIMFD